jgi:hypothetical protein
MSLSSCITRTTTVGRALRSLTADQRDTITRLWKRDRVTAVAYVCRITGLCADQAAAVAYRVRNPMSRITGDWSYTHNGGTKAERSSATGYGSTSWCAKWRRTVKSIRAEIDGLEALAADVAAIQPHAFA